MKDSLDKVKEFMVTFKQPVLNEPIVPNKNRIKLRLSLCLEELTELAEASASLAEYEELLEHKLLEVKHKIINGECTKFNTLEVLDALIDMRYVNDGAIHEFGLGNVFNEGFDLVHESNMSKVCNTIEEALATQNHYRSLGIGTYNEKHNNKFVVYRQIDGKVLKSINWKEADYLNLMK